MTLRTLRDIALPAGLALLVTSSTLRTGLPVLRHDWRYSAAGDAIGATLVGFSSGWLPQGLGAAQPYPTLYLIGFVLWPLTVLQSPLAVVAAIIGAGTFIASRAAMKIGAHAGRTASWCGLLGIFAATNPWVYCELVAGHIEMMLAYALLLALVAELTRPTARSSALVLLAAFSVSQIEFFTIAFVPIVVWSCRRRRYAVLAALGTATAPVACGIIGSYGALRSIPYILPWQAAASVPLGAGSVLMGYEFGYGKPFEPWLASLTLLGVLAVYGMLQALRRPLERVVIALGIGALVFASGTIGPIAPLYTWIVLNVPESGLFRELYDLIAIVAIAYVVALARVALLLPVLRGVAIVAACTLCLPWLARPVAGWTVAAASVPLAPVVETPQARVALFPAFQPLSFKGRGSGFDPDAFVRTGKADPLDEFYPTFPVDSALASAERDGDTRALAALGVTQVIVRPYFASHWEALQYQLIGTAPRRRQLNIRSGKLAGRPLLSLIAGSPRIVAIGNEPGEDGVFFGDLGRSEQEQFRTRSTSIVRYDPLRYSLDPRDGWVDARLAVASRPEWGTAFGGVMTSSNEPLDTKGAAAILAQASGTLISDSGSVVTPSRLALHWWRLPSASTHVTCRGTCIVVMGTTRLPRLPEHAAPSPYRTVEAHTLFPWLAIARFQQSETGTLRYAVRYDSHWLAFAGGRILPHVRLAMALNGWLVDGAAGGTIYLVEWLALLQAVLETFCIATLSALIAVAIVRHRASLGLFEWP